MLNADAPPPEPPAPSATLHHHRVHLLCAHAYERPSGPSFELALTYLHGQKSHNTHAGVCKLQCEPQLHVQTQLSGIVAIREPDLIT